MGRITIFTAHNCRYSKLVQHALEERNIPYTEISFSDLPKRRADIFALTQRTSTPQVFFNTRFVGGCDETLKLLTDWDADKKYKSARGKYLKEIESSGDPSNTRLQVPSTSDYETPALRDSKSAFTYVPKTVDIPLPSGPQTVEIAAFTDLLCTVLPADDLNYNLTTYKRSAIGKAMTDALANHYGCNAKEAEAIGRALNKAKMLHHVCWDHDFKNTDKYFYRLQCHQEPEILNSFYILAANHERDWDKEQVEALLDYLERLLDGIESDCMEGDGRIRYQEGGKHKNFLQFEEVICDLQGVSPFMMSGRDLEAFKLNVYSIMMRFAFLKHGIPRNDTDQVLFLQSLSFNIGGEIFSFSEWLRFENVGKNENRKSLLGISFAKNADKAKRKKRPSRGASSDSAALAIKDCRLLFATNYFWTRATAIRHFTADSLEHQLDIMAIAFCESDSNVMVDPDKGVLHLSNIFSRHRKDFPSSTTDRGLVGVIFAYVEGTKRIILRQLLEYKERKIKLAFHLDDWACNAADPDAAAFQASSISANSIRSR